TVVDFEHGLNTCIRQLRLSLGDDAEVPRFIETVPRLGYRFKAEVAAVSREVSPRRPPRRWRTFAVAAALIVTVAGVLALIAAVPRGAHHSNLRPDLQELLLRGRLALEDPSEGAARGALELFEKVLAADPAYAPAQAAVADVYLQKPSSIPGVPPDV